MHSPLPPELPSHPPCKVIAQVSFLDFPLAVCVTHGSVYVSLLSQLTPPSPFPRWAHLSVPYACVYYFLNCLVFLGQVSYHLLNV